MRRRGFFGVFAGAAAIPVLSGPSGLPADAWLEGQQGGSIIVHPNDAILLPRMAPGVSVVTDPSCPRETAYSVSDDELAAWVDDAVRTVWGQAEGDR
jgi:hypothetical protein